jgi:hypothetical protein
VAHVSGNTPWLDFPTPGAPQISAARLEAIEGTRDALYVSEYGSLTRTKRPQARIYWPSSVGLSSGDFFVGTGWTVASDTDSAWTTAATSFYTIPISGRLWDLNFHLCTGNMPTGAALVAAITLNVANIGSSITRDARPGNPTGNELHVDARSIGVPLTAGDKLYFVVFGSVAWTMQTVFGAVPEITIKDAGPA